MMAGSTIGHALVRTNINNCLISKLNDKGCLTVQESVYLKVISKETTLFLPDVIVTFNPEDFDQKSRYIMRPSIIIEILSESTEHHHRGEKWAHFRKIPSFKYYLLVSQKEPLVEVYGRPYPQSLFYYEAFEGLETTIDLREFNIQIPMAEVYAGIIFETKATLQ